MAAPVQTPRAAWVDAGLRALGSGGPDAVRVEALAKELGVTKGGFYWHFAHRGELLEAVLDAWERQAVDRVVEQIEAAGGDARRRLHHLVELAASTPGLLDAELAVRDWSRRDPTVNARLRGVDTAGWPISAPSSPSSSTTRLTSRLVAFS